MVGDPASSATQTADPGRAAAELELREPVLLPDAPVAAILVVVHGPSDRELADRLTELAVSFDPGVFAPALSENDGGGRTAAGPTGALPDTVRILLAPDEETFRRAAGERMPDWGLAVAFPASGEIVLRSPRLVAGSAQDPAQVLAHELAHVYVGLYLGDALHAAPRWFQEGLASLVAGEWGWAERLDLALALVGGRPLGLARLERGFPAARPAAELAYLESLSAVAYLRSLSGERGLRVLLRNLRRTQDFDRALRLTYGITYGELQQRWGEALARRYGWAAAAASSWSIWVPAALAVVLLVVVRRTRYRRRLAEMARREEAAGAAETDAGEAWREPGDGPVDSPRTGVGPPGGT